MTTHQPLDATVLAVWFRPLVDYLEFKNLDSRAFCRQYNLDVDHVFSLEYGFHLKMSPISGVT